MLVSVIIPCYKSARTIRNVVEETEEVFAGRTQDSCEILLVNDASPDQGETLEQLKSLADTYENVMVVDLAWNAGQHKATLAGMHNAKGDALLAIDDDMQTHPSEIRKLLEVFTEGYEVVYGYYPQKQHDKFRNLGSWVNHKSACLLLGKPKDLRTSSFWICRRSVCDRVIRYEGTAVYLPGLFLRSADKLTSIPVEHHKRESGTSGYTLKKLAALWCSMLPLSFLGRFLPKQEKGPQYEVREIYRKRIQDGSMT